MANVNTGILHGVAYFIDRWLDSEMGNRTWRAGESPPHFECKRSYPDILRQKEGQFSCKSLIEAIMTQIEANRYTHVRQPGDKNWRWKKRTMITEGNADPEVNLERNITRFTGDEWVNQVPVASGYLNESDDKGRHVDLVRKIKGQNVCDLIELKVESDHPIVAALEILCYGLLYSFGRAHRDDFGFTSQANPILWDEVRLRVLAPVEYYQNPVLEKAVLMKLEDGICSALESLKIETLPKDFKYQVFGNNVYKEFLRKYDQPDSEDKMGQVIAGIVDLRAMSGPALYFRPNEY